MLLKEILIKIFSIFIISFFKFLKLIGLHIRINELETRAIGHYSKTIEIYILENIQKKNHYFDIWFRNKKIANKFLYKKWKEHLIVFPPFLRFVFNIFINEKKFDFIIPYKHWRLDKNWIIDTNKTLLKNNPLIQFSDEEKNSIKKILEEKNIDLKKNFFCFANRDSKYTYNKISNLKHEALRNFSIHDYNYSLSKIVNENFSAVRMGKTHTEKISLKSKNVIDLPFLNIKNDMIELFLISKCNYLISGDSGLNYYSSLFRKPLLMINVLPTVLKNWNNENCKLVIFKKFYSSKLKKHLNYSETEEICNDYKNFSKNIEKLELKIINNTEIEIYDLIKEYNLKKNDEWTIREDELEINSIIQNFSKKVYSTNFSKINVGYKFAKENIELFK